MFRYRCRVTGTTREIHGQRECATGPDGIGAGEGTYPQAFNATGAVATLVDAR